MAALDNIASELIKSANEADLIYKKTRDQTQLDKAVRLRRIVENLSQLVLGASDLNGLSDVTLSAPANGQVLTYNSTTNQWENQTPGGGGGGGDMYKSTYDVDNDGIVDGSETTQIIVRNSTGSTLTKGQVVYLSGATGNRPNAILSQANTEATSSKTIGIVVANIANNSDGYVAVNGTLHDLDTSAFADGDAVWLSATVAGGLTATVPAEPNHTVFIGYIARSHPTQGRLVILIQNGYELNELHGVLISSEANNDLLVYESSTSLWKNKTISTIFGGTPLVSVPTLDQVTTAGNTTTNAITVGGLTISNGSASITKTTAGATLTLTPNASDNAIVINNNGFIKFTSGADSFIRGTSSTFVVLDASYVSKVQFHWGGSASWINTGGNLLIGTTTDAGYKLDVNGTARIVNSLSVNNNVIVGSGVYTPTVVLSATNLYRTIQNDVGGLVIRTNSYGLQINDVGTGSLNNAFLTVSGSKTASSALAQGVYFNNTLVAAANNDVLVGLDIAPTFTNGAFTGVTNLAARIQGNTEISRSGADTQLTVARGGGASFTIQGKANSTSQSEGVNLYWTNNTWLKFVLGSSVVANFSNVGNLLVGTSTDAGYKLDVNGTSRFQGSVTNTSGGFISTLTSPTSDAFYTFTSGAIGFYTSHAYTKAQRLNLTNTTGLPSTPNNVLLVSGSITASSALAAGVFFNNTLVAAANNDVLVGLDINPTFTNGAFTGVANYAARITGTVVINAPAFNITNSFYVGGSGGSRLNNIIIGGSYGSNTITDAGGTATLTLTSTGFGFHGAYDTITASAWVHIKNAVSGSPILRLDDTSGVQLFTVLNSGNVLVNTTTDAGYKLDVNGTIRSSGTNGLVLYDGTYGAKVSMSSYLFLIEKEGSYGVSTYQFKYNDNSNALYLSGLTSIVGIGGGDDAVMMSRNVYARHDAAFGFTTYGSTTKYKAIQAIYTDNNTSGVAFNYKTGGTDTEAMRITSTGKVGIGTTSPSTVFHVDTSVLAPAVRLSDFYYDYFIGYGSVGATKNNDYWQIYRNASQTYYNQSWGGHYFVSNSTDLLRILQNGNVLIGTTTDAGYKLDVNGTARVGDTNNYGDVFVVRTPGIGWSFDYQYLKIGVVLKLGADRLQLRVNNNTAYVYNNGDSGNSSLTVMGGHDGAVTQFAPIIFGSGRDASLARETMRVDNQNQRVGIGTTSPIYNLEVSSVGYTGFGIMSGANNTAEISFQNRGYGLPRWTIRATSAPDGSSGELTFQRLASSFDLTIKSTGNVLIGTTTDAGYKLDINGIARVGDSGGSGQLYIKGFAGTGQYLYLDDGSKVWSLVGATNYSIQENGTSRLIVKEGGNVGIGTTNPTDKLQVAGNVRFGTGAVGTLFFWDNVNGRLGIGNTTPSYKLEVNGGAFFNEHIIIANGDGIKFWVDKVRIAPATIDSLGFYTGTIAGSPLERMRIVSNGNVLIGTTTDAGYKLDVNGQFRATGESILASASGNVGIGTVSPTSKLHINGADPFLRVNNVGSANTHGIKISYNSSDTQGFHLLYNPAAAAAYLDNTYLVTSGQPYGDIYFRQNVSGTMTTRMTIKADGGNVGIGTTNPTDKFHIVDNTNGNKFARISAGGTDASAAWVAQNDQVDNIVYRVFGSAVTGSQMGQALARSASLIANLGGTGKFLIGSYSGTDLIFGTSDQARMRLVDATGNFLIGTMTDNGNKLTVSGNIDAQGYKVNNVLGYTGILNIPTNPPGQQNIDIQGGIVINIF